MTWKETRILIASIFISELAGVFGAVFTTSAIPTWYAGLLKPTLNPPSWVFGPVWVTLYALMGIALFLVWKKHSRILQDVRMTKVWRWAVDAFTVQLVLNALWSLLFFGARNPALALIDIVLLLIAICTTMVLFYRFSKVATYLLVPYVLWVSFATYLNYSIWMLN